MSIDATSSVPFYRQLATLIERRIAAGDPARGRPLPSVARLAAEYGVAIGTVRHALRVLAERGVVHVVDGKGTYPGPAPD